VGANNNNVKHLMLAALYNLKRRYGGRIDIYKMGSSSTNPQTGERTVTSSVTVIRRAVILPADMARREFRGGSLSAANKTLVQGGWVSDATHVFVIDRRDAPGLNLAPTDWITLDGQRCDIAKIEEFPFQTGWVIQAKAVLGDKFTQAITVSTTQALALAEDTDVSQS